jgi:uncharacterized protein
VVEQLFCKQLAVGSNPSAGSTSRHPGTSEPLFGGRASGSDEAQRAHERFESTRTCGHGLLRIWRRYTRPVFGRKEATASTEDATKALYVHLAFDGGIFVVRGDGRQAWMTRARLDDELVELRASGGRLIYSRDDPEHEPSEHVHDVFKRIVDSRPAGIQLLEKAHPVAAAHGKQDVTMLMLAAHRGEIGLLTDLIARHVPLEARSNKGYTALMLAANSGKVECARLLLDANADPNARDNQSSTPVMFAAQHGSEEIVRMLLEHGADRSARGDHGRTAADLARQKGHQATVNLLEQSPPA